MGIRSQQKLTSRFLVALRLQGMTIRRVAGNEDNIPDPTSFRKAEGLSGISHPQKDSR
jgi:hypothetical protein